MKLFAEIKKRDEEQRMVWGYASTEAVDSQGEVVKLDAIKGAWDDYMKFANIREMHQQSAVGKCKEYEFDDKGVMIGVKVVDDAAWAKVVEGVYSGFSIGGKAIAKADGVISQLRLTEISLVDRPANPEAVVTVFKGEDIPAQSDLELEQPATEKAEPAGDVKKGLYETGRFADMLEGLAYIAMNAKNEADWEGDNSPIPAKLGEWVKQGAAIFAEMAVEEMTELMAVMDKNLEAKKAAQPDDVQKAGARFSKGVKAMLAEVHGMMKKCDEMMGKLGYADAEETDDEKADKVANLQKSVDTQAGQLDAIAKALDVKEGEDIVTKVAGLTEELAKADARIKELEAEPVKPAVAITGKVVEKGDDGAGNEPATPMAEVAKKLEAGETVAPAELLKAIHSHGGRRVV